MDPVPIVPAAPRRPSGTSLVLGVDVGTTSVKVAAFGADGVERGGTERPYPLDAPHPGHATQDPHLLVRETLRAVRDVAAASRARGDAVAGLALSTAMHGLCAIGADDVPLTPLLTWADGRAVEQAARLRAEDPGLHGRTGTPVHPMTPLAKLAWFAEHDRAIHATARRWVGVKELVLHALTGEWVVDASVASGTGLWNADRRDWDPAALRQAGIDRDRLARLVPTDAVLPGLTAAAAGATGLPRATPVVAGAGDGPLANVGVGAVRPGVAACSIGTSGALRLVVDRSGVDAERRLFSYVLDAGRWVTGGAVDAGGVVLRWAGEALAPDLGAHPEAALLHLAAAAPPGADGLVLLPSLLAERAPGWRGEPLGAFVGLTARHRREHLARAVVEGVCLQLALVLDALRDAGHPVDEVRGTGGFARSPFWRGLLADVLGVPVAYPGGTVGSGRGAALVGLRALGLREDPDDDVPLAERRRPDPGAAERYAALRPVVAELQDALAPRVRALRRIADGVPPAAATPSRSRPGGRPSG